MLIASTRSLASSAWTSSVLPWVTRFGPSSCFRRFKFGGWEMPYFDQEFGEEIDHLFNEKFDLLLGRKTYEIFAAYWPYYDDAPHGGIARLFNDIKKYAVSRSGEVETSWAGSVLL